MEHAGFLIAAIAGALFHFGAHPKKHSFKARLRLLLIISLIICPAIFVIMLLVAEGEYSWGRMILGSLIGGPFVYFVFAGVLMVVWVPIQLASYFSLDSIGESRLRRESAGDGVSGEEVPGRDSGQPKPEQTKS